MIDGGPIAMTATTVSCSCGKVELAVTGTPIVTAVCYCDDCQRGARQIAALPDAAPVLETDDGCAYVLYRRDRFECVKGREWLRDMRLKDSSPTRRVIAGCCNSAMFVDFKKGHWVSIYRARFRNPRPPVQMHIQTQFKLKPEHPPSGVTSSRGFPPMLFVKLISARIAMLFS
jgi:hypothetical protein